MRLALYIVKLIAIFIAGFGLGGIHSGNFTKEMSNLDFLIGCYTGQTSIVEGLNSVPSHKTCDELLKERHQ